ncbi:lipopolysaccharide biosynthesis protein [Aequorivita aquimaris]|nr:polysaccharide biosynthesis C-terminal domain-containing protein [Aequorivita aquimaris]
MQVTLSKLPLNKAGSLFLRMSAMGSKFLIFTYLSKYFDESVYGVYSLLSTTVTIAIFVLGFDFYNYAIRDILLKPNDRASKVATSFIFYGIIYVAFIIVGYLIFDQVDYLAQYTTLIIFIGISEHLNQEIYRLLLAFKKVLVANWFLFLRVAGWTIWVLFQIVILKKTISLEYILFTWLLFNGAILLVTLLWFNQSIRNHIAKIRFKKHWLTTGLKVSLIFYTATLALKVIEYSNRYIVEGVLDEASAGIFSFYSNISMVIGIYISTVVVSYELPDLIESSTNHTFESKLLRFKNLLIRHSAVAFLAVIILIYPILLWQGKDSFAQYWPLIILLNAATFLMNVSLIYHSYLYIKHQEKKLLQIVLISSVINVISTFLFSYLFGIIGAGIAFLITGITIFVLRKRAVKKKI